MIRFLLLNSIIAGASILYSLLGILLSLFDRTGGERIHRLVAEPWARLILRVCGVKVVVRNLENLDPTIPRLYLSNHQSYFDIFVLLAHLPVHFKFVMKEELMRVPLLGPAMRGAGYIGIDRDDPRKAIRGMNEAAEKIRMGASILVFPEGTRSVDGELQDFKSGGFHLALKAGCDAVPLAILRTRFIVPKGSLSIQSGTCSLHIGKPIPTRGVTRKNMPELMARVREAMIELMKQESE
ncbi:MAG: lysophospholipid acyltransferase family protein [Thermodesulfobacteriota bacterium]